VAQQTELYSIRTKEVLTLIRTPLFSQPISFSHEPRVSDV